MSVRKFKLYSAPRHSLPLRETISGSALWDNTQHRNFERLPTNKQDDALPFAHSNFKVNCICQNI